MTMDVEWIEEIHELERRLYELRKEVARLDRDALPGDGPIQVLVCRVGSERMGLALADVLEVVPVARLAALPEAPAWVVGILNLRGESLPVLDASSRMARAARSMELSDLIVICTWRKRRVGLVVQEVFDVVDDDFANVQAPGDVPHAPYLAGVLPRSGRQVFLLSVERLFALSDIPEEEV